MEYWHTLTKKYFKLIIEKFLDFVNIFDSYLKHLESENPALVLPFAVAIGVAIVLGCTVILIVFVVVSTSVQALCPCCA